ncbi:DUF1186 domain-containing protein [Flavobacterium hibisci]|uniref:DUF1186 domain-containing protein n=1 Tax=Flavobacterium hibisci TaxID=1914462 RepID=UPI001CBFED90|nr:DUF1186 domain-containing protein [Flavobacterium hibisci]
MKDTPILHHKVLENLFKNRTLSNEQLEEILANEKNTLTQDLQTIIKFCSNELDDIDDEVSYNLMVYTLFLLKECEREDQLNLVLDILKWSDDKIEYWFGDLFTEYYWGFVYHFGQDQIETLVDFLKQEELDTFSKEQVALALYQIYLKNPDKQNLIANHWTELLEFYNSLSEESTEIDPTYLAFFTSYIFNPSDYQKELIENLYDKGYVDFSVNGDYDDLFEIVEPEKNIITVFELNDELINFEKGNQSDFNSKLFEEFNKYQKNGATIVLEKKINRNDPCPCGSGKKYKKCCLS